MAMLDISSQTFCGSPHAHIVQHHYENWYRMAVKEQERPRTIHASISIAQNLHLRKFQFPAVELVFKNEEDEKEEYSIEFLLSDTQTIILR